MKENTKKVVAGITAGTILATMAGCSTNDSIDIKQDNITESQSDVYTEETTSTILDRFLDDYNVGANKETTKVQSDIENTTERQTQNYAQDIPTNKTSAVSSTTTTTVDSSNNQDTGAEHNSRQSAFVDDSSIYNESSNDFNEKYERDYQKLLEMNNMSNVLIVSSKNKIKDTFGAIFVVEAPYDDYYLQYNTEEEKNNALEKFMDLAIKGEIDGVSENSIGKFY